MKIMSYQKIINCYSETTSSNKLIDSYNVLKLKKKFCYYLPWVGPLVSRADLPSNPTSKKQVRGE